MADISYTDQQLSAIKNRGGALLVSAAAGSGKTHVLIQRLMKYVQEDGLGIDQFLIITFTNAAANELRTKIMQELSSRIAKSPENRHLRSQLVVCQTAHISTIHSYCSDLIRENAQALDLSPDFRLLAEEEIPVIRNDVLSRLLEEKYETIGEDAKFEQLINTLGAGRSDKNLIALTLALYEKLSSHADMDGWINAQLHRVHEDENEDFSETDYGKIIIEYLRRQAIYWRGKMAWAYDRIIDVEEMRSYLPSFAAALDGLDAFILACDQGWEQMRQVSGRLVSPGGGRSSVCDAEKEVRKNYNSFVKEKMLKILQYDSRTLIHDGEETAPVIEALCALVRDFAVSYDAYKRKRNLLDFSDLEHHAVSLLYDKDGEVTAIAREQAKRFTEVLIDEYQDVNRLQEKIFTAVSRDGKNLFMVGDVKQSIYRFRMADPGVFIEKYDQFRPAEEAGNGEGRKITLSSNFRSRKGIIDAVNDVFEAIMTRELGEIDYTDDQHLNYNASFTQHEEADAEFVVLDVSPKEDQDADEADIQANDAEAEYIARRIRQMVDDGCLIKDGETERPVRYSDFAILLRSGADKEWRYAYALRQANIPIASKPRQKLIDTTEVNMLLCLLSAIDNPRQDLPLISIMTSPIFGFTSDELAQVRISHNRGTFYEALRVRAEQDEKCRRFLDTLTRFRRESYDMPADHFIWRLFDETGLPGIAGAMKSGDMRRENLMNVYRYAKQCEKSGYKGLFSFMLNVRNLKNAGKDIPAATSSAGGDAVALMTVHKSKGLEFPVVFLPDLTKRFNLQDTYSDVLLHTQLGIGLKITDTKRRIRYSSAAHIAIAKVLTTEQFSEEMRVLYVAMTRAKEKLILIASYKKAEEKLLKMLPDAEAPVPQETLLTDANYAAWILKACLNREDFAPLRFGQTPETVRKGASAWLTRFVSAAEFIGKAQMTEPEKEQDVAMDDEVFDLIVRRLSASAASPVGLPSKITATELKGMPLDSESAEDAAVTAAPPQKPVFRRPDFITDASRLTAAEKGSALHLVMQYIRFSECGSLEQIRSQIDELEQRGFLSPTQAASVEVRDVYDFFQTELGRRILQSGNAQREFKYSLLIPGKDLRREWGEEKILYQGVVDLFFEENGKLILVDFKTDRVTAASVSQRAQDYARQVDAYRYALEKITGKQVGEAYLYYFHTHSTVKM